MARSTPASREDVARLVQVGRLGIRLHRSTDGVGAVVRRDAGGDTLGGLDADREVGLELCGIGLHHRRQAKVGGTGTGKRQAHQAAAVGHHEVDVRRLDQLGGHDQLPAAGRQADKPFHVTGDQIDFKIDRAAHARGGEGGVGHGVRDQGDFKAFVIHFVDGEADAVHADRTLLGDVAAQRGRCGKAPALGARVFVDGQHLAEAIDVAADQMAAEAVGRAHGALQIDDRALAQLAQRGQAQGLGGGIGLEAAGVECDDGEADAVDGDALAHLHVVERQIPDIEGEADIAADGFACGQTADAFDDSSARRA
ncbi:hypothetical protein G6F50_013500 [Rhizopus delemar]|uniref:Uncharacterized protein n=1 Tax=Rhizopus delemar TaxID=936053 RepID=A0A9P6YGK3_9FUNG|nr:hypothetical protein G6F50_013500 [Rhizopus delemar]